MRKNLLGIAVILLITLVFPIACTQNSAPTATTNSSISSPEVGDETSQAGSIQESNTPISDTTSSTPLPTNSPTIITSNNTSTEVSPKNDSTPTNENTTKLIAILKGAAIGFVVGILLGLLMRIRVKPQGISPKNKGVFQSFFHQHLRTLARFFMFIFISAVILLVYFDSNASTQSLAEVSGAIGFFLYILLIDKRLFNAILNLSNSITKNISLWTRGRGEDFGVYLMLLSFLILALSLILGLAHIINFDLIGFGFALLFGGVGFIAVFISEQSDRRMNAMAELELDDKMAILCEHITNIRNNPFHTNTDRVFFDVRSVSRLAHWIQAEDLTRLLRKISELELAVNELQGSTTQKTWEESAYPKLMAELDKIKASLRAAFKLGSLIVTNLANLNGITKTEGINQDFNVSIVGPSFPSGTNYVFHLENGKVVQPMWTLTDLVPGSYTIIESSPGALWTVNGSGRVKLNPEESSKVTITNTFITGTLVVSGGVNLGKLVNPTHVNQDFIIVVSGPSFPSGTRLLFRMVNGVLQQPTSITLNNLIPGSYTIAEIDPGISWNVVVSMNSVNITPGESADVAITNTFVSGNLLITNAIDLSKLANSSDVSQDFTFTVSGPSYPSGIKLAFRIVNGETRDPTSLKLDNLIPGNYFISVGTLGSVWKITSVENVSVNPGGQAKVSIVCTYTPNLHDKD